MFEHLKQISTRGILKIKEDTYVGSYSGIFKNGIRVFPEIEHVNSNLILLPNSPQAGSDMLNNMVASFTASNVIGEAMKKSNVEKGIVKKPKK